MRQLVYVSASTLPSAEASAVHIAQMCDAFAGAGCQVTLRAWRGEGPSPTAAYDLRNRFRIAYESRAAHWLWMFLHQMMRWRAAASSTLYFGRRLPPLSKLSAWGYPVACEIHHPPRTQKQRAAIARLVQGPRFLGLVTISERLRDELLRQLPGLDPARVLVAPDGVRADRIHAPKSHRGAATRAVYCGSFHEGKGVDMILLAAALVPEVDFDLIGGEPGQIEAVRAKAPANVHFIGRVTHQETQRRLPAYDFALAPYGAVVRGARTPGHESLASWMSPLKIFEYMGAGLPIVTTDLPVLHEILTPGKTALMSAPDDVASLASAIRTLVADGDLRYRLACAAQEDLRELTWEARAERILRFLVGSRGGD